MRTIFLILTSILLFTSCQKTQNCTYYENKMERLWSAYQNPSNIGTDNDVYLNQLTGEIMFRNDPKWNPFYQKVQSTDVFPYWEQAKRDYQNCKDGN